MPKSGDAAAVKFFPPGIPLLIIVAAELLDRWRPIELGFEPPVDLRRWAGPSIVAIGFFGFGVWSVILVKRSGQSVSPWQPTPQIVEIHLDHKRRVRRRL